VAVARFTGSGGYTGDVEYPLQEPCGLPVEIAEGMRLAGWEPPNLHEYLRQNPRIWQHFWPELFSKDELPGCLPRGAPFQRTRGSHKRGRSDETAHTNLAAGPIGTQPSTFPPQNNQPEFGCEDVRKKPRTGATHYDMDEDAPTCFNGPESYTNRHVQYQPSGRTQRPKVTTQIQRHRQETTNSRAQRMGPYINQQFHNIIQDVDARARQAQVQPNAGSRHVSTQASNPTPMHRGLKHGQSLAENTDWEQHNPLLARSVDKARNELSIPQSYQVPTKLPAGKINMRKKSRRSESPNSDTGIDLVRDYHGLSRPWFVSTTKSAVQASHTPPGMPSSPSGQESREANGDATAETVEDTQSNDIFSENEPLTATEDFGNPNGQPQPQSAPSCPQNEVYDDSGFVEGFLDHSTNNYPSFLNLPENGVSNQPGQFQCWWDGNDFRNVEHNHGQLTGAYALNMQPLTEYGPPRFWEGYNNNLGDGNGQSQLEDVDNAEFGLEQWQQELTQSTQPTQPGSQYGGNDTYPVGFGHTGQEQTEAVTQPNFVENTQLVKGNGVQGGALSQSKLAWPIDPQLHNGYVPHSDQITSTQPLERNEVEDGAPQIESHEQSEEERLQELWHHVYTHPGGVFEDCPSCREHAKLMEAKRMEAFWGSASP
jgi:hypothetical protein